MLNILYGRAGAGKTGHIMLDIKRRMAAGESGMILIVPEQYSHDAERKLCAVCGDALSLHAEVLSFTRLCRHVLEQTGGAAKRVLDKSGQILVMHKALEAVEPGLKVFGIRRTRTEMLESLLTVVREFQSMCISPEKLKELASKVSSPLSEKLQDFALITDAYDALRTAYGFDAAGRLEILANKIGEGSMKSAGHIYFDGFNDFTAQEMRVIEELVRCGADVTVCLTCELEQDKEDPGYKEIFMLPRRTIARLSHITAKITYTRIEESRSKTRVPELAFLEKHLFDETPKKYQPARHCGTDPQSPENNFQFSTFNSQLSHPTPPTPNSTDNSQFSILNSYSAGTTQFSHPITILAAPSRYTECEYAACMIWDMVRGGCRWREIGVMARDFPQYETVCEQIFEKYGIPYFSGGKADIRGKPPIALIDAALEIATMGWEYKYLGRYLKTGLLPLSTDEAAMLENYIITWNIRGKMWLREWIMPPSGYKTGHSTDKVKAADEKILKELNKLRVRVTKPLAKLSGEIKGHSSAEGKLRALYEFITDIELDKRLLKKAGDFSNRGQSRFAGEYTQLLNIIIDALDQVYAVLGKTGLSGTEFKKLIMLVLSQHDVGVIPMRLDAVPLGSMAMSRRRDLKALIILGATDENIPQLAPAPGILSDNERASLAALDKSILSGLDERLYREMNMVYSTLTLPSEKLAMIYDKAGGGHPSFVVKRLCEMFNLREISLTEEQYMGAAETPYTELQELRRSPRETAQRQQLSPVAAEKLYGKDLTLSATRADRFYSCAYRHFLQSGLRLSPRRPAQFDAASAGDFMHSILDGVFKEIEAGVDIKKIDDAALSLLASKYAGKYVKETLLDFEGKNERFKYLFRNYEQSVLFVLRDMTNELLRGEFKPVGFELDISQLSKTQKGFIDRVDAYKAGDKLYLRVIDYKTRKKAYAFELCDVLHGRDMQMLIYMFALQKYGRKKFAADIEPAGVLYIPARDVMVNAARHATDEEVEKIREKEMRRSGLILNDPGIIEAMEAGDNKKYLPVRKSKEGAFTGESLVSKKQLDILAKHIEAKMNEAKDEILSGANACEPYYKNAYENACTYCEYYAVCRFDEQMGDKRRYAGKMKAEEVWRELGNRE